MHLWSEYPPQPSLFFSFHIDGHSCSPCMAKQWVCLVPNCSTCPQATIFKVRGGYHTTIRVTATWKQSQDATLIKKCWSSPVCSLTPGSPVLNCCPLFPSSPDPSHSQNALEAQLQVDSSFLFSQSVLHSWGPWVRIGWPQSQEH